ncbi:TIGR01777 family oxidoreductase [Trueperella pecoris]|uniref:TIGR01777 family oxidoreductase n=1 Tax=Trueperella pecoris TaxID=2733571 RepID=UPI001ABDFDD7|nr:TIGR01777 family oxidoreductase [Trueperella pecoris]QTG76226.1 TIGR01777 family oxidoreductase [Trueperella pecoris]
MTPPVLVLAGASGFIGSRLVEAALSAGYRVRRLVRSADAAAIDGVEDFLWDPSAGTIDDAVLAGAYGVICLNGAGLLSRPWTPSYKKVLWDSRIDSVTTLVSAFAKANHKPKVFISGSAIGYYGADRAGEYLSEGSASGEGFLAELCRAWEEAAGPASGMGIRTVVVRTGLVMGQDGGMLGLLQHPYRAGLGAQLGDGTGWMSTIARDDYVRALLFLLREDDVEGPVNMTNPDPVPNKAWNKLLAEHVGRRAFLAVPRPVLMLVAGQMGRETMLASQRVYPDVLFDHGFEFLAPTVEDIFSHELPMR